MDPPGPPPGAGGLTLITPEDEGPGGPGTGGPILVSAPSLTLGGTITPVPPGPRPMISGEAGERGASGEREEDAACSRAGSD